MPPANNGGIYELKKVGVIMKIYDEIIIGGGICGIMAAKRLVDNDKKRKVAIIEKGRELTRRKCPASDTQGCVHCGICSITSGMAGAGAFSDGKFNLGTAYGGTLGDDLGENKAMYYIDEVDRILSEHAEDYPDLYRSNSELKLKCVQNNLTLLDMNVRHLGTDKNFKTMFNIIEDIEKNGVEIFSETTCKKVKREDDVYRISCDNVEFLAKHIIVATGRTGAPFVEKFCNDFGIKMHANAVDIGVRVEMKDIIWREFSDKIYEPKILYKSKTYEDKCRMFCFNQGGYVSAESNDGIVTANGHSYADADKKSDNCNFAILSSIKFTEPFNQPTKYATNIAEDMNMIGAGNVVVQRFGDLIRGRRTTDSRLAKNTVIPTLKATPGDIGMVMPHRHMRNIIETIYALDKVAPGTANDDTLLYGCENKYYSIRPHFINNKFEVAEGIYILGDGSGICRGLSQSGAMGIYAADCICDK